LSAEKKISANPSPSMSTTLAPRPNEENCWFSPLKIASAEVAMRFVSVGAPRK